MNDVLWHPSPSQVMATRMDGFRCWVNRRFSLALADYPALYHWSIEQRAAFWQALAEYFEVRWHSPAGQVLDEGARITDSRWFPGATLNFAEHLLQRRDHHPAVVAVREDGNRQVLSHAELAAHVAGLQRALQKLGIEAGDRVAAVMPNTWQTLVAMLACASLGAIWSSSSPDFGTHGIIDRFSQIEPRLLIACAGYEYAGKSIDQVEKINDVLARLPSVQHLIVVPHTRTGTRSDEFKAAQVSLWDDFYQPGGEPRFTALPFDHPLYILYSSGTTGVPKCIVHRAGGVLLQHLKDMACTAT
ncbi:Acetyl-coenzyme A synthetase [Pseudomonas fluorescens]|nr:Acetyl-coenzyme A synthetase [Pseudomonas fluorescens]